MTTRRMAIWALAACFSLVACADEQRAPADLSAAQIVEKYVHARGGVDAWRKIETMVWFGHVEGSTTPARFVLALKRPNKTHYEVFASNRMALRVYDGARGWKLHPAVRGTKPEMQPYTPEELKFAHDEHVIDGLLIDYEAKGVAIALDGLDEVEGKKAYRLNVTLPSGTTRHVWIDAHSFLEVKEDREVHSVLGQTATVVVYYRDYRTVEGLKIPFMIESGVVTATATNKLVIDKLTLNQPLEDRLFEKPVVPSGASTSAGVDTWPGTGSVGLPNRDQPPASR
ncbi:hypothetical protein PTE30175_00873 [Pandoraea terrae]|uniref:Outer membrane lipoprotein-sorting protein n=1 Tax=Pandoraea terrae TaxID=1537710 RepID=A0A5E4STQ1_9BURK|nr:hypothetical protein [Pandoraea terrae]VVD77209.1 hypothetical protein PTE30175_00873 [Pandoraea terrae]